MKALILREFSQRMSLETMEDPKPGPHDLILRVTRCGVCGTDVKITTGLLPPSVISLPHVPGHEIAGVVEARGSAVENVSLGQRGVVYFVVGCHDCEMCRTGREHLCLNLKRLGFELPGGFAEYVKVPAYNFCPFDDSMPDENMAVLPDAVATPYRALTERGGVKAGSYVLIVGIGGLGVHAVQIAKLMGARVIAVDMRDESLQLAKDYGAEFIVNPYAADPQEAVMDITRGRGVDTVIENVGIDATLRWTVSCLARGGTLVIVGYDPKKPFQVSAIDMHFNEWNIHGSRVSTKQELMEVITLVETGKIKPVIAKHFPWEQADEALMELKRGETVGRTVLTFN